jgi:hypothetical protein
LNEDDEEVPRLQFEFCVEEIGAIETKKSSVATTREKNNSIS